MKSVKIESTFGERVGMYLLVLILWHDSLRVSDQLHDVVV